LRSLKTQGSRLEQEATRLLALRSLHEHGVEVNEGDSGEGQSVSHRPVRCFVVLDAGRGIEHGETIWDGQGKARDVGLTL